MAGIKLEKIMKTSNILMGICIFTSSLSVTSYAQQSSDSVIRKCESCHGSGGNSASDTVPRLNGQQALYLRARLFELRDPTRGTGHSIDMMFDNATSISDTTISTLADYFAAKPATAPDPKGSEATLGKRIYENGASNGVSSCSSCHGLAGEGHAAVPRLAGQHKAYLLQQLEALTLTARASQPMNHQAYHLTEDQMKALAAYLGNG
jgi:cytochrome c553